MAALYNSSIYLSHNHCIYPSWLLDRTPGTRPPRRGAPYPPVPPRRPLLLQREGKRVTHRIPRLGRILTGLLLVMIASFQALGPSEHVARIGAFAAGLY